MLEVSPRKHRETVTSTAAGCSSSSQSTGQGTKHQLVVKASRSQQPISLWAQLCCQHGSLSLIFVFWRGQQPRLCSPKKFPRQPYNNRSLEVLEYSLPSHAHFNELLRTRRGTAFERKALTNTRAPTPPLLPESLAFCCTQRSLLPPRAPPTIPTKSSHYVGPPGRSTHRPCELAARPPVARQCAAHHRRAAVERGMGCPKTRGPPYGLVRTD